MTITLNNSKIGNLRANMMLKIFFPVILFLFIIISAPRCYAAVEAFDTPNDGGGSITLKWGNLVFQDDVIDGKEVIIYRKLASGSGWQELARVPGKTGMYIDKNVEDGVDYIYRLIFSDALNSSGNMDEIIIYDTDPASSSPQFFDTDYANILIGILICAAVMVYFIYRSRQGKSLYIRPIAGLEAVDDAVGRATELGKPILYSTGRGNMQRVATISSMTILSSVAEKTAEYNIPLIFPNNDAVVTAVAQEVVRDAYSKAGHPDRYREEDVFYLTDSQFGYAAAVDGIMTRRRPATNLFMGTFEAESLILAETGNSIGAIQIAGTDSTIQLSFFIVACDYVLIGEEYFAASGYLSQDPMVLGSLKGQDLVKIILGIIILTGALTATFGFESFINLFG